MVGILNKSDWYVYSWFILSLYLISTHCFQGHELALHVLYHLHSLDILDSVESSSSAVYEKFLLVVVCHFSLISGLLIPFPETSILLWFVSDIVSIFNCRQNRCWILFQLQTSLLVDFLVKFQYCPTLRWNYYITFATLMLLTTMGRILLILNVSLRALALFGIWLWSVHIVGKLA